MAEFSDLLNQRRSVRVYQDKEVPLETIKEIIEESCLAPSSGNGQPWRFVVIGKKTTIKRISDESKKNLVAYIEENPGAPISKYEGALRNEQFNIFYNAPSVIYITGPQDVESVYVDCTLAACYFMFSAANRGLGTCWIGLGTRIEDPGLLDEMGIPTDHRIVAPITLGYPKGRPGPRERNEPSIFKVVY